jgi:hypothetical protein
VVVPISAISERPTADACVFAFLGSSCADVYLTIIVFVGHLGLRVLTRRLARHISRNIRDATAARAIIGPTGFNVF